MFFKKLNYRLKLLRVFIEHKFSGVNLNFNDLLVKLVIGAVILALSYNIYLAYKNGQDNLQRIDEEEQKLQDLIAESQKLDQQEQFYQSLDFKKIYARDILNLAGPDETLYYVDRSTPIKVEDLTSEANQIDLSDNPLWWKKLIFNTQ